MLTALVANGSYSVRRAALHDEPQPFWGYWDGKEWEPAPEEEWPPELLAA